MLTRTAIALSVFLASAFGGGILPSQPASRPAGRPISVSAPSTAPASPEWDTFIRRYEAAVAYYREYGTWRKPATAEKDKKIAGELGQALGELSALLFWGQMTQAELTFARNEVKAIDFLGGRRSRNTVLPGGALQHADYFPIGDGVHAYRGLQDQIPELEQIAAQNTLPPRARQWVLDRVGKRIEVLADTEKAKDADEMAGILHYLNKCEKDPNTPQSVTVAVLRAKALSLVARIGGKE